MVHNPLPPPCVCVYIGTSGPGGVIHTIQRRLNITSVPTMDISQASSKGKMTEGVDGIELGCFPVVDLGVSWVGAVRGHHCVTVLRG